MVRGVHTMFYSSQARELREFLRDMIGFPATDVGDGWLIFNLAESDMGVHPTDGNDVPSGTSDISFYCDDIHATVADLKEKGVEFNGYISDQGFGYTINMKAPGGFEIMLYEPKYKK